jgi:hypothetical protein
MPGIMTGMILAMARGAGEVAPLMLVGVKKATSELPCDGNFPYMHVDRSFMHLGFHIYDIGFQSQYSEAAKPMVYTTTLLLIAIIASLNLAAIATRSLIVTHNMQQAARISDYTAFMYLERLIEYGPTAKLFTKPELPETEAYITGRFG